MSFISKEHDPQPGEETPAMDTISVKSPDPYVPVEPLYRIGAVFADMRKKVEKICPICGDKYTGLPTALACPDDAKKARNRRYRDKQKKLKLEGSND